jgi:hypothetical protein
MTLTTRVQVQQEFIMFDIICLLGLFGIKHFIADFVMQYPYMIKEKGTYGATGGIHHAMLHAVLTLWICIFVVTPPSASVAIVLGLLDGVVHYHIDWVKQQFTCGLTAADRKFWIWLGADQCLHYLTYVAIIGYVVT